jgi:peptidoglycan/xylan/chitin deacetylase (PgdA/CDA1 family)
LTRGLTVFIFHEITGSPSEYQRKSAIYLTPEAFIARITWIRERFTIIRPTDLKPLGGAGELPPDAALITFDDAWLGVFRIALPILQSLSTPALCFLNMATVDGDPDLSAVRSYEALYPPAEGGKLERRVDKAMAPGLLAEIRGRYVADTDFGFFQGPTATHDDLRQAAASSAPVWFGSHLYHHWDIRSIASDLYVQSLEDDFAALLGHPNGLPVFATPHGYTGCEDNTIRSLPREVGYRLMFVGTGRQNRVADSYLLDRITLPVGPTGPSDWWFATHRQRFLGPLGR